MALSCTTVAFGAYVAKPNEVYFGAKDDIKANPGDSVEFTYVFKSLDEEETLADVDREGGVLNLMFNLYCAEINIAPFKGVDGLVLTDEAKKAGITLTFFDDPEAVTAESYLLVSLSIPAKLLFTQEEIEVFKLKFDIDESWEVIDYKETAPISVSFEVDGDVWYVTNPDGSEVPLYNVATSEISNVTAKPYQPGFFERVWEWIKAQIRLLIDIDNIIDNLLYTEVFNPADWYNEYKANKDAEKAAKQAEKEAKKAENAAG